jgi:hypothetical protein
MTKKDIHSDSSNTANYNSNKGNFINAKGDPAANKPVATNVT